MIIAQRVRVLLPPSDLCFAEEARVFRAAILEAACVAASSVGGAEGTYSSINVI